MAKTCKNCGASVPADARFCPECGSALAKAKMPKSQKSSGDHVKKQGVENGMLLLVAVLVVSVLIAAIYSYDYLKTSSQTPHQHQHTQEMAAPANPMMDMSTYNQLKSSADGNPSDFDAQVALGNFLFDSQRYQEALTYYERALKINPNDTNVIVDAGVCYFNENDLQTAKKYFERALKIDDRHPNALFNLGVVYSRLGNMPEMLKNWERLVEVAPESGPAQTAKDMLDEIKGSMETN